MTAESLPPTRELGADDVLRVLARGAPEIGPESTIREWDRAAPWDLLLPKGNPARELGATFHVELPAGEVDAALWPSDEKTLGGLARLVASRRPWTFVLAPTPGADAAALHAGALGAFAAMLRRQGLRRRVTAATRVERLLRADAGAVDTALAFLAPGRFEVVHVHRRAPWPLGWSWVGALVLAGGCIVAGHPVLGVAAIVGSLACRGVELRFENRKVLHAREGVRLETVDAICRELVGAERTARP